MHSRYNTAMGNKRAKFVGITAVSVAIIISVLFIQGCWAIPPVGIGGSVPSHTDRNHALVSLPAFTADGGKFLVNGPQFRRYSPANELVHQAVIALPASWKAGDDYPNVYTDAQNNLYLDLGDEFARINEAGEVLWRIGFSLGNTPLFPSAGGVLAINHLGHDLFLTMISPAGVEEWVRPLTLDRISGTKIMLNAGTIYVFQHSQLDALALDGAEIWGIQVGGGISSSFDIGIAGDIIVVSDISRLFAYDATGATKWSLPVPQGFGAFREVLVLHQDRVLVKIENAFPNRNGVLILDGAGNQVNLLDGFSPLYLGIAGSTRFLSLDNKKSTVFIGLHDLDSGELLWAYQVPEAIRNSAAREGDIVDRYFGWPKPTLAPNGLVYFRINSTLYELNQSGNLVGSYPSTVTTDIWVEGYMSPSSL